MFLKIKASQTDEILSWRTVLRGVQSIYGTRKKAQP